MRKQFFNIFKNFILVCYRMQSGIFFNFWWNLFESTFVICILLGIISLKWSDLIVCHYINILLAYSPFLLLRFATFFFNKANFGFMYLVFPHDSLVTVIIWILFIFRLFWGMDFASFVPFGVKCLDDITRCLSLWINWGMNEWII